MDVVEQLIRAYRTLRECDSIEQLLARAATLAPETCSFDRGLVPAVGDGRLSARLSAPLTDPDSDELRRRLLAEPVQLVPGTPECEAALRRPPGRVTSAPSRLAETLGLREWTCAAVAPEAAAIALVVVDRADGPVTDDDQRTVTAFAEVVGVAVEQLVLRTRVKELAEEVRQFSAAAQALAREAMEAPVALPSDHGFGPALPRGDLAGRALSAETTAVLSERERRIAELLVLGLSNREIADTLVVSPETVKSHVARILRKLGAANRVEAVSRLLRVSG
jgi:DNA-binding CsgD family transcriptional regulator